MDRADTEPPSETDDEPQQDQERQGQSQQVAFKEQENDRQVASQQQQKPSQVANSRPQGATNPADLALQNQALLQQLEILKAQTATPAPGGQRIAPVRQSRIVDRQDRKPASDSSVRINIELDLEVEVDLYARVKGDVTIGLM